jgi:hypothetical protein
MRLKIDVLNSTIEGLRSDAKHVHLELCATKESLSVYEKKTEDLIGQLADVKSELN